MRTQLILLGALAMACTPVEPPDPTPDAGDEPEDPIAGVYRVTTKRHLPHN